MRLTDHDDKQKCCSSVRLLSGLFIQDTESLSIKFPRAFGPAAWVFVIIWPLIYFWNLIGILYLLFSMCCSSNNSPILRNPPLAPNGFLILWIVSWGCSTAWLFAYDREQIIVALVVLIIACWSSYGMLAFLYHAVAKDTLFLEENHKGMLFAVRIILHNGLGVYATWTTLAWLLNLATVINYDTINTTGKIVADMHGSLTLEDGGTVILSILMFELILWFALENFVIERYCRYTLTIYPTLILALTGSYVKFNTDVPNSRNQILNIIALALSILAFIIRVPLVIIRHRGRPHY